MSIVKHNTLDWVIAEDAMAETVDDDMIVLWVVTDGYRFDSWWVAEDLAKQRAHELRVTPDVVQRPWICIPLTHAATDDIASVEQLLLKLGAWLHKRKA